LNNIYEHGLDELRVHRIQGFASFVNESTIKIVGTQELLIKGKHILIAVGGKPASLHIPGGEHIIDSDGFFHLEQQPKKVGIIGAGYIAVELAGVFHHLGSDVTIFCREDEMLEGKFDPMLSSAITECYIKSGEVFTCAYMFNCESINYIEQELTSIEDVCLAK
jgi:glutathione reductase (NADPH)